MDKEFDKKCKEQGVSCILFDGRIDITNVLVEADGTNRSHPARIKEEHYSVVSEPGSDYLFHFTPPKATKEDSHAGQIAKILYNWLQEKGFDNTLLAIGGDSTNVNTGVNAGVMRKVELHLKRKLVWIVCSLHTNELPLRHLIINLDGPTSSNNTFSGKIGKLLPVATDLKINQNFQPIRVGPPLLHLTDEVVSDLSTDQHYGYMMVTAICNGDVPQRLAMLEVGPVNHSRWLTTANRLLRLYVSDHQLDENDEEKLRKICAFVIGVYYPCWFNIKVKHSWIEGPRHVLFQLACLQSQPADVIGIVSPAVKRAAWYAHSEHVIQTLLCSNEKDERTLGVNAILKIRGDGEWEVQLGNASVRVRKTPEIELDATSLLELLNCQKVHHEPPLTCDLTTSQVKQIINAPMEVPDWPCHTQSIERVVKMVTEASGRFFTQKKRDGGIRAQEFSRRLMAKNETKRDLLDLID